MSSKKITLEFNSEKELNQYKKDFLLSGLKKRNDEFNKYLKEWGFENSELHKKFIELFGITKK